MFKNSYICYGIFIFICICIHTRIFIKKKKGRKRETNGTIKNKSNKRMQTFLYIILFLNKNQKICYFYLLIFFIYKKNELKNIYYLNFSRMQFQINKPQIKLHVMYKKIYRYLLSDSIILSNS